MGGQNFIALSHLSPRSPNEITALGGGKGDKGGGGRPESAGFFQRSPPRYEGVRVCVFLSLSCILYNTCIYVYIYIYIYIHACILVYRYIIWYVYVV